MTSQDTPEVVYVADLQLIKSYDEVPFLKHRASLTHHLIAAYGLLSKMKIVPSKPATEEDLRGFHSEEFVEFLKVAKPDDQELIEDEFGLGFDCPIINNLWTIVCQVTGASLTAACALTSSKAKIAINWCGGWHHAQRDSASGFCYVNDIVLAMRHLRTKFDKILYIDLDIHHGDGVENAFLFSPKVVTLSFHQLEAGFFPGTGQQKDVGLGKGRYYTYNVPYKAGINNDQFVYLVESILYNLCEVYMPNAVVCQCGGDAVIGDPLGGGNLTPEAFRVCVRHVLNLNKPTLFLGGGGYNVANTARLWTAVTSTILDTALNTEIPEHQFFPMYGPSFELEISAGLRKSENTQKSLDETVQIANVADMLLLWLSVLSVLDLSSAEYVDSSPAILDDDSTLTQQSHGPLYHKHSYFTDGSMSDIHPDSHFTDGSMSDIHPDSHFTDGSMSDIHPDSHFTDGSMSDIHPDSHFTDGSMSDIHPDSHFTDGSMSDIHPDSHFSDGSMSDIHPDSHFTDGSMSDMHPDSHFTDGSMNDIHPDSHFTDGSMSDMHPDSHFTDGSMNDIHPDSHFSDGSTRNTHPDSHFSEGSTRNTHPDSHFSEGSTRNTHPDSHFSDGSTRNTHPDSHFSEGSTRNTHPDSHFSESTTMSNIHSDSCSSEKNYGKQPDRDCDTIEASQHPGVTTAHEGLTMAGKQVLHDVQEEWPLNDKYGTDSTKNTNEIYSNNQPLLIQDENAAEDAGDITLKDKDGTTREAKERKDALRTLHQEGEFEDFIEKGPVVIVYFYKYAGGSEALAKFLSEFNKSAEDLLQYQVLLAVVDCAKYNVAAYCMPEKVNRFAYGFRNGLEKIAFPLDTLFNNNAIVASALHLALISAVPILQTAGERRDLEARCRGRCDIIFSFLHTLGTFEHRMFLEVAHAHQDKFVFAITTYAAGTFGLANPHPNEEREYSMWVVHCADKAANEECVVSHYRRKLVLPQLLQFIHALQLPIWHELSVSPTTSEVVTPYDGTGLPWVILLYDVSSRSRVRNLAPRLAQLLHGSVATITVNLDEASDAALAKLGLTRHTIMTPALAFLQPEQESASLLNDYDNALEWVNEQLTAMLQHLALTKEEQGYLPVPALEELQQDDEVVLAMVKEDTLTSVPVLAGPGPYTSALESNTLSVIAFYLSWDPMSNALLQHMNAIVAKLREYGSQSSLHRVNCFDWPYLCNSLGIVTYPVLRLHPKGRPNMTYDGPIHGDSILKTILLTERATPTELINNGDLEQLMTLSEDLHPACKVVSSATVGIFPSAKDAVAFNEACRVLGGNHLLGRHISPRAVDALCKTDEGCVVVTKPGDCFQSRKMLDKELDNSGAIINFVSHASLPVLAPLDPERYSALQVGVSEDDEHSPVSDQHLVILFLPSNSTVSESRGKALDARRYSSQGQQSKGQHCTLDINADHLSNYDSMWSTLGHLAAELSEPGFIFSWLFCDDPLADSLLPVYGLSPVVRSLVAVSQRMGTVYTFMDTDTSKATIRDWLKRLRAGHLQPSIELPKKEWKPRVPGFDYLKFMIEDQDRDSEDHLILEMEADLTAHHQGESSNNKK
ncbi:uncharacterized protein [Cherax quadricarinatus]